MIKIVIVGGVAGGASTAARLRRRDETAQIILFERGAYISYANCGLPYYIGGMINNRSHLFLQTPESFSRRFNLDIRVNSEVIRIDRVNKMVEVKSTETGDAYTETYDKLVLSPGAEPVRPPIPGIELPGIFTLRNVPDTDRIKTFLDQRKPKRAIIVGAGFIGLEMAENLHRKNIFVTIVEMAEQVMTPLDYEMAAMVHQHLKTKQVEFYLKEAVTAIEQHRSELTARLSSGKSLKADMIILSIGVRPENRLALDANLAVGKTGGIQVNEYLQTSDPDIYALGDAIETDNPIINRKMTAYLAGPANRQGRIVADNIATDNTIKYHGSITTAIAKVFDLTVASTGVSEKMLIRENIPYVASITHGSSHAGYYPGSTPLTIKIQFSPSDGRVFGAQIIGYDGVDKRIDMIANTLKQNGTVCDLMDIEHAYAPPFSSAKDPVNIAGFVADNILHDLVRIIQWRDIEKADPAKDFILDVRTLSEVRPGVIEGSYHIPLDDLRERLDEIPKDKRILVYCAAGLRAYLAVRILTQHGFRDVYNLSGGYITYEHATQKQSNEDIFDHSFIHLDGRLYSSEE